MRWTLAVTAASLFAVPAAAFDWSPRQANVIRAANQVVEQGSWAYMNSCEALNGKARYAAALDRVKALTPLMEKELGAYPVYEIFVLRAPVYGPKAHPPKRCKPKKTYRADREAIMQRFETAVAALEAALKPQ
jgi:hypothetical protein